MSHEVDALFFALIAVSLFFLAVIFLPIIFFAVKYRRGSKADRSNPSLGSLWLEGGWTMGAIVLGLGLFSWGALTYFRLERRPANAIEVQVVGKQWMWKLQHAEGKREIDELHVPVNQTVALTMTSQDVIHSFFIPAFRVKQDVVPGKYTSEWFKATKTGEYHLFCAEYCGTQHSGMIGRVVVMDSRAYKTGSKRENKPNRLCLPANDCFMTAAAAVVTRRIRNFTRRCCRDFIETRSRLPIARWSRLMINICAIQSCSRRGKSPPVTTTSCRVSPAT